MVWCYICNLFISQCPDEQVANVQKGTTKTRCRPCRPQFCKCLKHACYSKAEQSQSSFSHCDAVVNYVIEPPPEARAGYCRLPVEAEEGIPNLLQLIPFKSRHLCVMPVPVVVALSGLRILIPCTTALHKLRMRLQSVMVNTGRLA